MKSRILSWLDSNGLPKRVYYPMKICVAFVSTSMMWRCTLTPFIAVAAKLFQLLVELCMPVSLLLLQGLWNQCTFAKFSVLKTQSVESMVCSIVVVDTFLRRTRFPEHPCSTLRHTCLSTNLSVSLLT